MPTWRCPHCGTPQAETARCWVCRRSSTACDTCRYFRRSIAGSLGYCGLDRRRAPLRGNEIRACWEARPVATIGNVPIAAGPASPHPVDPLATTAPARGFVDIDDPAPEPLAKRRNAAPDGARTPGERTPDEPHTEVEPVRPLPAPPPEPRWNLWGDLDL